MQELYLIRNKLFPSQYWDDDVADWFENAGGSLFEKINGKYYSPSGEQLLPKNGEWFRYHLPNESAISCEEGEN